MRSYSFAASAIAKQAVDFSSFAYRHARKVETTVHHGKREDGPRGSCDGVGMGVRRRSVDAQSKGLGKAAWEGGGGAGAKGAKSGAKRRLETATFLPEHGKADFNKGKGIP